MDPPDCAVVTLVTSDSYLPGALVTLHSLVDVDPNRSRFDSVCLTTPSTVGHNSIKALEKSFDVVCGVETITTESWEELKLLGRQDLAATLTKLHVFRLTQYRKIIFLDADTLVLRPLSNLFDLPHPFAAAPDQGWPDAFNSGVFVAEPSQETFDGLISMMQKRGTWDGGDQGLLNDFFPNWHRLSFTFNVTPSAYYTYAPAYKRHGQDASVLHFIGADKPWKRGTRATYDPDAASKDYYGLVNQWYDVFERHFGTISTYDVASRVRQPPASFRSTFTSLPALPASQKPSIRSPKPAAEPAPSSPVPTISIDPPPSELPPPVPIVGGRAPSPPQLTWDPSRSSPPRNGPLQMRDAIPTADYSNAWDASPAQQRQRFEPPQRYPDPPKETHDWYKDIMRTKPDPSAIKPVFPWEEAAAAAAAGKDSSAAGPSATVAPPPPTRTFSDEFAPGGQAPPSFRGGAGFTNAWDAVPGIKRYADQLAKRGNGHGRKASGGGSASGSGSGSGSGSSGAQGGQSRASSHGRRRRSESGASGREGESVGLGLRGGGIGVGKDKKGKKGSDDGDASSRDGDDEDDEDADISTTTTDDATEDSEEEDRIAIRFRRAASTGELSPTNRRSKNSQSPSSPEERGGGGPGSGSSSGSGGAATPAAPLSPPKTRKQLDSRYVPTSPRQPRSSHPPSTSPGSAPYLSLPSNSPGKPSLRLAVPGSSPKAGPPSPGSVGLSPRAQAVRNSAHARMTASGAGHGDMAPPVVRATRVFRPETDTGVVKQQGLAALQRFVQHMEEAQNDPQQPQLQPFGSGGGVGSSGSMRW
ncbi:hypothetical protein JCM10207_008519 [Rhodosporidiobolus poonsookiae]